MRISGGGIGMRGRSMDRKARPRLTRTFAAGAVIALASVPALPTPTASAIASGVLTFQPPMRMVDTRFPSGMAVTTFALGQGAMIHLTVLTASGSSGQPLTTVAVHPCSQPAPTGEASFVLRPDDYVASAKVVLGAVPTCLTASLPIHVIIDKVGTVLQDPIEAALQYVALDTQVVVLDGIVATDSTTSLPTASGVPATAKGLVVLLDATEAVQGGFLRTQACMSPQGFGFDVSYGNTRSSGLAYIPFDAGGSACLYSLSSVHVKATVLGYFTDDGPNVSMLLLPPSLEFVTGDVAPPGLRAITPVRVLDTRNGIGRPGTTKVLAKNTVQLTFGTNVASTTTSVVLNVTATGADADGFITAYPCDRARPTTSNLNYTAGGTSPNLVVVKVGADRSVCLYTDKTTHILADLTGTMETQGGARGKAVVPTRILDTRNAIGVPVAGKINGGQVFTLQVTGHGDVPLTGATAATLNITAVDPNADGFLTVWPCDQALPTASSLNFAAGDVVPNLVTTKLSPAGTVCVLSTTSTHLLADVGMWFGNAETAGFKELVPDRLLDTRNAIGVPVAGKVTALGTVHLQVAGRGGVPLTGVTAVALNLTAVGADADGYVTAWPCDQSLPVVSNLNFSSGQTIPNAATVKLAADGSVCLFTTAMTHLLADVAGYFTGDPDTGFVPTIS